MARITVKNDSDQPVPREVLAEAIVRMSEAVEKLKRDGINERAIVILLQASTNQARGTIQAILNGLANLRKDYCR